MKKILTFIILFATVILLALTCPDKDDHKAAISHRVSDIIDSNVGATNGGGSIVSQGLSLLGSIFAVKLVDTFLDNRLVVHNYVVCSVGEVSFNGKKKRVSFGVLNNVFTFSEKDLKDALSE